jgi:hypothetical protein
LYNAAKVPADTCGHWDVKGFDPPFDHGLAHKCNYYSLRACLGISGMKGNEGYWGGQISIISQNFSKSPSILLHPLESSISQTSPKGL